MATELRLFGRPSLRDGGGAWTDLGAARNHQVLAYVAVRGGWISRSELAAVFWPEHPPALASANVRKALFRIQESGLADALEVASNAVRVNAALDTRAFEQALAEQRLDDALALYAGDLLAGYDHVVSDAWQDWLRFERDRLRSLWRAAALARLATDVAPVAALDLATRLLAADPTDEDALLAHVRCLHRQGEIQSARRAHEQFVARLHAEFGLAPSQALAHEVASMREAPLPAPADGTAETAGQEPPGDDPGFVGRDHELRQIAERLAAAEGRLVTLTGPGGTGKSRLARRALARLAPGFPGGAHFVALEDLRSPDEVPARIVRELGLGATQADAVAQLLEHLRGRRVLLVLDNFEHLTAAAAVLGQLLDAGARAIVTSRVRLHLPQEQVLAIGGLPCPDPEDRDHAGQFDAVRLFVQRARQMRADFALAREAGAVLRICRLVDGHPLALELAASWVSVLSCGEIAEELARDLQLLHAPDPSHPARHASLDTVFENSWAMLGPQEQEVLARLSVFRGGFTPDAARACAQAPLVILRTLTEKSLVTRDGDRLALHPVLQQLARAKMTPEVQAQAQAAHGEYYLRLLGQSRTLADRGDGETLARLDLEADNWTAAWLWAVRTDHLRGLMQGTPTLRSYADHRGRAPEARRLVSQACERIAEVAQPVHAAVLLAALAHLEQRLDRFDPARAAAARALAMARRMRDLESQVRTLNTLGACDARQAHTAKAGRHYRLALKFARKLGMPRYVAVVQQNLAQVERRLGRNAAALDLLLGALQSFRQIDDHASQTLAQYQLGMMQCEGGPTEEGMQTLHEALALAHRHGLHRPRAYVLTGLAETTLRAGNHAAAQRYATEGLEICRVAGMRMAEAGLHLHLGQIAQAAGDFAQARQRLMAAMELALAVGSLVTQVSALFSFADLLEAMGEPAAAAHVFAWIEAQPRAGAQERARAGEQRRRLGDIPVRDLGLDAEALCARVVKETPVAYAPLLGELRAPAS